MKTNLRTLKWMFLLLILAATSKVWAQPYPVAGNDQVCLNETKNYAVVRTRQPPPMLGQSPHLLEELVSSIQEMAAMTFPLPGPIREENLTGN